MRKYYTFINYLKRWIYRKGRLIEGEAYYISGEIKYKYNYVNGIQQVVKLTHSYKVGFTVSGSFGVRFRRIFRWRSGAWCGACVCSVRFPAGRHIRRRGLFCRFHGASSQPLCG